MDKRQTILNKGERLLFTFILVFATVVSISVAWYITFVLKFNSFEDLINLIITLFPLGAFLIIILGLLIIITPLVKEERSVKE